MTTGAELTVHDFLHGGALGVFGFAAWNHSWWLVVLAASVVIWVDVRATG